MSAPTPPDPPDSTYQSPVAHELATADELRRLVLGHDRADLLDRWAEAGPEHLDAAALSDMLPDAVRLRERRDDELGRALEPSIESGLRVSVERDPQPIADILFPVMGPAIRRAVRQAVASSMDNLNRSVNYGLSWKGLKWRVEAWRRGVSFGEVVLHHTLRYRVEQVLLVHRETGLPLQHAVAPEVASANGEDDADLVSSMLTALRQFVGDSFDVDEDDALNAFQAGDLTVWAETGPDALLATVVRGTPSASFRERMAGVLATLHAKHAAAFDAFEGDATPFESTNDTLRSLLDAEYADDSKAGSAKLWILALLLLGLLGYLGWRMWETHQREAAFLQALEAEPGVTVLRTEREGGRLVVIGASDPLGRAPLSLLPEELDSSDVDLRFVSALSDDPQLVAQRATRAFDLPDGVTLRAEPGGRIIAEGDADTLWAAEARRLLPVLGARQLDVSGLVPALEEVIADVEALTLTFEEGSAQPVGMERIQRHVGHLAQLANDTVVLIIEGHTDDTGTDAENQALSLSRAVSVRNAVLPNAGTLTIRAEGYADTRALESGVSPSSRRVTFRVESAGNRPDSTSAQAP
ncbi:MAG: OmpA family protein [Bacteroidota bacterium]